MLQPRTYPELMGKALVLEAEPFVTMVDDDNPWVEGLFMVVCMGVLIGFVQLIGGLLLTASLPPSGAVLEAVLHGWRQLSPVLAAAGIDPAIFEESIRQTWYWGTGLMGYGGGWTRLLPLVLAPMSLLLQWLVFGLVSHGLALALGGRGRLNQTLGATALMVAPQALYLFAVVPFVSIGSLFLLTWAMLITYRAIEVAHELPWQRAASVALAAPAVLLILVFGIAGFASMLLMLGGAL